MQYETIVFRELTLESLKNLKSNRNNETKEIPNKELAVEQTLPEVLQSRFPDELIGKPIEEIDDYYRDKNVC